MRIGKLYPISLGVMLGAIIPLGTIAADQPAPTARVNISMANRPDAVRVSGIAVGAHGLQAVLYATLAPDIPRVFLSRQPLPTDAGGHFDSTLPIAPAFFSGALITVVVQTAAAVSIGVGSVPITAVPDPTPVPR